MEKHTRGIHAERDHRIEPLRELNRSGRHVSWEERATLIKKQFPSTEKLDWNQVLTDDVEIFGAIVRDILRYDQADPTRDGPKPEINYRKGMKRYQQLAGGDFSLLGFPEAFRNLIGDMSLTPLARKTSMSRMNCSRLLRGEKEPDLDEMTLIANAFKKHPSYFLEYRTMYVFSYLSSHFEAAPEVSVDLYKKLRNANRKMNGNG